QAFHVDCLGINYDLLDFSNRNLMLEAFFDESGLLIGHLLYGYLDSSQCVPDKLSECQFILPKEHQDTCLTLYIISSYSSLAQPRVTIILMILDMLKQNANVRYLQINCHNQDWYSLYSDHELIHKGEAVQFGGVKVYGKRFRYVRIKVKVESILASKIVSDIILFTSSK
ncbi:hypothetical protein AKJ18_20685, partial [Vibrio xuii]